MAPLPLQGDSKGATGRESHLKIIKNIRKSWLFPEPNFLTFFKISFFLTLVPSNPDNSWPHEPCHIIIPQCASQRESRLKTILHPTTQFIKQECRGQSQQVRLRANRMKVLMAAMESWCNKLSFETSFVEISKIFPEIINIKCKFQSKLGYDNIIFWSKFIISFTFS